MTTTQSDGAAGRHSALYTPEAVRVDLPLADLGSRTLAILIDLFLMLSLLYLVLIFGAAAFGVSGGIAPDWLAIVGALVLNFLVLWGYPTGCEAWFGGRTAGKAALGLRVVTVEGAPVRFRHAAIRGLFAFIDFYLFLGIPALVTSLVTRKGQRLGDLAAGTVTIRDRSGTTPAEQVVFWQVPPTLQSYASTIDVRGLSTADYAVIRRFLLRSGSLKPQHRARIATDIANVLASRMNHRPPAGTHPEAMLLCVAALLQQQGSLAPAPRPPAVDLRPPPPGPAAPWSPPATPPASPSGRSGAEFAPPS
ncbi:MAG: RDD family protein [Euzebya sp.]